MTEGYYMKVDKYTEDELYQAMPLPLSRCGQIKIQIRSEKGKSKWLNVSADKMKEIEQILIRKDD